MPTTSLAPLFNSMGGALSGRRSYYGNVGRGVLPLFILDGPSGRVPVGGGVAGAGQQPLFNSERTVPIAPYTPPPVSLSPSGAPLLNDTPQNPDFGGVAGTSATGAPAGQSFSEGAISGLTGLGTMGNIGKQGLTIGLGLGSTALGLPVSVGAPLSGALALESGLKAFTTAFPNLSVQMGLLSGVRGNTNPAIAAQRAGERSISGGTADDTTSVNLNDPDIAAALSVPGPLSETALQEIQSTISSSAAPAPTGQVGLTAQGGLIGGVGGPPGGMASVSNPNTGPQSNVVESAPGSVSSGVGVAGPGAGSVSAGLTGGEVGVAGQGGPGDGGGDGGGGGCFLASFAMEALPHEQRKTARRFFRDFYNLFIRAYPDNGLQLFRRYQVIAKKIITAIRAAGAERIEQRYIYNKLIKPTGRYIEQRELQGAIRNLQSVVITLAKKYDVPLPARRVLK